MSDAYKQRILVVEDDSYIREAYSEYLSCFEADIDYAETKLEALERIRCKTYHLAIVDIMLKEDVSDREELK